jgi:hypothetical protein
MADAFTPEQEQRITDLLGTTVNNMISARLGTFEKKLSDKLGESVGKLLDDKLKDFKPPQHEPPPNDPGGDGKGKNRQENIELATLKKRTEDQAKQIEELTKRANGERTKNRSSALRTATYRALAENGIDGELFKEAAFASLKQNDYVRFRDEESDDLIFVDAMGVETELGVGMKEWVKSPQAKLFIPPTGSKGSGGRPPAAPVNPAGGGKKDVTFEDVGNFVLGSMNGSRASE